MMQAGELYRIRFSEDQGSKRSTRVGLLHGRTGVPLFLFYLEEISSAMELQCNSLEGLEAFSNRFTSPADRAAILELRSFFEEGGGLAQIVASPLRKRAKKNVLSEMLGYSKGFNQRTGLHLLSSSTEHADLVIVPQARTLLSGPDSLRFHEKLLEWVATSNATFALIEPPRNLDPAAAIEWARKFSSPDAAAYYPAILHGGVETSALPCLAAHYQITDRQAGLAELPTRDPLKSGSVPSLKLTPSQQMELLAGRINTVIFAPGARGVRVWGGHTLARPPDMEFALIPVRRTLRALREALENIAEEYVLEPLSVDIAQNVEMRIAEFLLENKGLFDLYTTDPFEIKATQVSGPDSEGVEIFCRFRLSRCVQELRLNFGVSQ